MNTDHVNKQVYILNIFLLKAINHCAPFITSKIKGMPNKWMNGTIKQKIKERKTKKYLATG